MSHFVDSQKNNFLKYTPENADFNQYWYSEKTIEFIINQLNKYNPKRIGFIAVPSIFFTLPKEMQDKSFLFDIDDNLISKHKNGIKYDYLSSDYSKLFPDFKNTFDFLIIDPPFITEEAWIKFSEFAKFLASQNCKILASSILENSEKLENMLKLYPKKYKPSIPHLVYQYNFFSNYDDEELNKKNEEILED